MPRQPGASLGDPEPPSGPFPLHETSSDVLYSVLTLRKGGSSVTDSVSSIWKASVLWARVSQISAM